MAPWLYIRSEIELSGLTETASERQPLVPA